MTFWHYHWALIRARELDLSPFHSLVFGHMGQLANQAGAIAYSIASMADDIGCERASLSRIVRRLWTLGAINGAGKSSRGRHATIYRMVPELEARGVVETWRYGQSQPCPRNTVNRVPGTRNRVPGTHTTNNNYKNHEREARFVDPPELTAAQKEATRQRRAHALRRGH